MGFFDALTGQITDKLIGSGLESGIEAAGERAGRARFRTILYLVTLLVAIWVAVSSALLWSVARLPNVSGLWQFAQVGGPGWVLATPICAALLAIVLLIPLQGRLTIAVAFASAAFGFGIASLAALQQDGNSPVSAITLTGALVAILLPLLTLLLAFGEAPPIDSAAARISLVYWGRLGHLRALKAYGLANGFTVSEPNGSLKPLTLTGNFDATHPITITSGASFTLSTRNSSTFSLSVKMGSPYDIVSMRVSSREIPKPRIPAIIGQTGARLQRKLYFAVAPEPNLPPPPLFPDRMAQIVEAGRPFMRLLDHVQATPFGIRYTHLSSYGLTKRDAQLDPLLQWMRTLIAELEPISPAGGDSSPSGTGSHPSPS